jgi:aspartyl-tRNA(Asn)/glutamyl-tRNA(Gln) amidotransferase subunit A
VIAAVAADCLPIRAVRQQLRKQPDAAHLLIDAQHRRFQREAATWQCVAQLLEPSPSAPGLLHGIGLAHKDVFHQRGRAAGVGQRHADGAVGAAARVLDRLSAAGAVNLGALTLAEWCCGSTGDNRHFGRPVNPLDPAAMVGGSSGGSAVAVAAGLCAASLGTDTAGSVRIPAASCGLVGLKPGHRSVDATGVAALAPNLDTVGLLARTASDAAHVWEAMQAPESLPPAAERSDRIQTALETPRRWRIGIAVDRPALHPHLHDAVEAALDRIGRRWSVELRSIDARERLSALAQLVLHVESAATHLPRLQADAQSLPAAAKAVMLPGLAIPATWYAQALSDRKHACCAFLRGPLNGVDLLITPALTVPVPDWSQVTPGEPAYDPGVLQSLHAHFAFVNYLGLPAVVLPVGSDARGRPVSLQAIGRPGDEPTLMAFAHQAMQLCAPAPLH